MEPSPTRDLAHDGNSPKNIPFDLTFEILSRLPAKSVIRFQCVSKLWSSIIRSKDFADSFLIQSKKRPRLLFTFKHFDNCFIFSVPEHDEEENSSTARHDMTMSNLVYYIRSRPVNGLICCTRGSSIAVCNPTTRQILKLPDVTRNGRRLYARLGYDPVQGQYKVLCVMMFYGFRPNDIEQEHLVFTLGSGQQEWKKIENIEGDPYTSVKGGICINGCIYYVVNHKKIARFDVRSEKIEFIKAPEDDINTHCWTLINHQGKLGGTDDEGICLHHEENIMTYGVPTEWGDLFRDMEPSSTGESSKPFSVSYDDMIRRSFKSANVQGIADSEFKRRIHEIGKRNRKRWILCFPGHIENIIFF